MCNPKIVRTVAKRRAPWEKVDVTRLELLSLGKLIYSPASFVDMRAERNAYNDVDYFGSGSEATFLISGKSTPSLSSIDALRSTHS